MNGQRETSRTTLRMPSKVKAWAAKRAQDQGISENALIILCLQEKMAAEDKFGRETSAAEIQTI